MRRLQAFEGAHGAKHICRTVFKDLVALKKDWPKTWRRACWARLRLFSNEYGKFAISYDASKRLVALGYGGGHRNPLELLKTGSKSRASAII